MKLRNLRTVLIITLLSFFNSTNAQSIQQEKMKALDFMVGEWIGTSTTIDSGKVTQKVPAFEKIDYDLNQSILVIKLNSSLLKLHTIIHYSVKDSTYYYYAFSEKGGGRLPAKIINGRLVVQAGPKRRYTFERYGNKGFREYGEKLINGSWVKYFEDQFTNTQ
jgi:hypothetical protein